MANATIDGTVVEVPAAGPLIIGKDIARRKITQSIAFSILWIAATSAVVVLISIIAYVVINGFQVINWEFLTTPPAGGLGGEGGISSTIVATFYLVILTIVIATPIGIGAAIYLAEYAGEMQDKWIVRAIVEISRFGVEILGGVPSIIFGLFGFALFVLYMNFGFSLLSGALSGACLLLPVIIRASEEALLTVPSSYRTGSLALGATKWQTIRKVVLPSAMPGIITGVILSVGRIVSETAVFYVTMGGSFRMPTSLKSSARSMALHVYYLASETRAFDKAMATGAILIITIVIINLVINIISSYLSKRLAGG